MKTDGKPTREKVHLGSGQLTTNPKHTVVISKNERGLQRVPLRNPSLPLPRENIRILSNV